MAKPAPPSRVIPALLWCLDVALHSNDLTRSDLARAMGVSPSSVTRWLDGRLPSPANGSSDQNPLDRLVDAVADLTGVSALTLWKQALDIYEKNGDAPEAWTWMASDQRIRAKLKAAEKAGLIASEEPV
jgi:hypothetical protein